MTPRLDDIRRDDAWLDALGARTQVDADEAIALLSQWVEAIDYPMGRPAPTPVAPAHAGRYSRRGSSFTGVRRVASISGIALAAISVSSVAAAVSGTTMPVFRELGSVTRDLVGNTALPQSTAAATAPDQVPTGERASGSSVPGAAFGRPSSTSTTPDPASDDLGVDAGRSVASGDLTHLPGTPNPSPLHWTGTQWIHTPSPAAAKQAAPIDASTDSRRGNRHTDVPTSTGGAQATTSHTSTQTSTDATTGTTTGTTTTQPGKGKQGNGQQGNGQGKSADRSLDNLATVGSYRPNAVASDANAASTGTGDATGNPTAGRNTSSANDNTVQTSRGNAVRGNQDSGKGSANQGNAAAGTDAAQASHAGNGNSGDAAAQPTPVADGTSKTGSSNTGNGNTGNGNTGNGTGAQPLDTGNWRDAGTWKPAADANTTPPAETGKHAAKGNTAGNGNTTAGSTASNGKTPGNGNTTAGSTVGNGKSVSAGDPPDASNGNTNAVSDSNTSPATGDAVAQPVVADTAQTQTQKQTPKQHKLPRSRALTSAASAVQPAATVTSITDPATVPAADSTVAGALPAQS